MPRRGRPALSPDGPSAPVSVKLPAAMFASVYVIAAKSRRSMPKVIREAVQRYLEIQNRSTPPTGA